MIKKAKNKYVFLFGFLVVVYCFILIPKAVAFFDFNLNDNGGFLSLDSVKDFLSENIESLNQIDYESWVEVPARQAAKKAITITRDGKSSAAFSLASVFSSVKDTVVKIPQGIMDYILPPRSFNDFADNALINQNGANDSVGTAPKRDEFKKTIQEQKRETENALSVVKSIEQKYNNLQREIRNIKDGGLKITGPIIEKKTIEKTLEKTISGLPAYSAGISQDKLDSGISALKTELNNINTNLINQINNLSSQTGRQNSATFQAIALTNRIDNLSGTKLSSITVSGVSGLTDADIPDTLTASLYLPLTGGTLTGNLTISGTATSSFAGDANFDSGVLYVDSINNRVGVGTTSPSDTLSLNGAAYLSQISAPSVTTDRLYNTSGDLYWNSNLIGSASVGNWTLSGGNVYRSSGNVGIGTTSPASVFHISPANNGKIILGTLNSSDYTGGIYVQGANGGNNGGFVSISRGNIAPDPANATNFIKMQENMTDLIGYIGLGVSDDFAIITGLPTASSLPANGTTRLTIKSGGNVGIGTTSPSTKLSVGGAAGDTTGHGYFTGGLGIGMLNTTAGTLNVLGQCVTADTLLRRRRRRKNGETDEDLEKSGALSWDNEFVYDEIEIINIKKGDEVASLDQETGVFAWSRVNGLLDTGIQPLLRITTLSGRTIRTTANHPYFVRAGEYKIKKDDKKQKLYRFEVDLSMKIEQYGVDTVVAIANAEQSYTLAIPNKVKQQLRDNLRSKFPREFQPAMYAVAIVEALKRMNTRIHELIIDTDYPSHEDVIVRTINASFPSIEISFAQVGKKSLAHFACYGVHKKQKNADYAATIKDMNGQTKNALPVSFLAHKGASSENHQAFFNTNSLCDGDTFVKRGKWAPSSGLKVGQQIAVAHGDTPAWERIVAIKAIPQEQVYDIEIDGTHNFIGNNIVAHNTYIGGSVGIGTTSPFRKLSVAGRGWFDDDVTSGYFTATSTTATSTFAGGLAFIGESNAYISFPRTGDTTRGLVISNQYTPSDNKSVIRGSGSVTENISIQPGLGTGGVRGEVHLQQNGGGKVSINNYAPMYNLDVTGDGRFTSFVDASNFTATSTTATSTFAGGVSFGKDLAFTNTATSSVTMANGLNFDNNTFVIDPNSGFVGVGTTSPAYKLDVNGGSGLASRFTRTSSGSAVNVISLQVLSSTGVGDTDLGASLQYQIQNSVGSLTEATVIRGLWNDATSASEDSSIAFLTRLNGTVAEKVRIDNNGNLGIGTTSPSTKLSVGGAAGDTTGHGYFTGGLGVGILNTTANTFRVGQCVTGDTKLRRRRRREKSTGKRSDLFGDSRSDLKEDDFDNDYIYDEVMIKDIAAGDEIASLDEKTGKIVWSKVKQLAYMGKKQTFKLTTEDGRQIRTTANHPYFAEQGWTKVSDLRVGMPIAVPRARGKRVYSFIDLSNVYHGAREGGWEMDYGALYRYLTTRYGSSKVFIFGGASDKPERIRQYENFSHIGYEVLLVPTRKRDDGSGKADVDSRMTFEMMRLKDEYDRAVVITGDGDFYWVLEYLKAIKERLWLFGMSKRTAHSLKGLFGDDFTDLTTLRRALSLKTQKAESVKISASAAMDTFDGYIAGINTSYARSNEKSSAAVDNPEAEPVRYGASSMAWVKIRSIEPIAEEDVYDVEIENTHNFIGNDIVAHNTAFMVDSSGSVGIGTTSPYAKLSVEGSSALGNSALAGYFTATTSTASVFPYASTTALTVSGNSYLGTISSGLWNGTLIGVPYGGTGWAAIQSGTIPYGNGASALSTTTAGTAGNVLAFLNGVPTWTATSTLAEITGTLSVAKGGTGQTSFGQGWLNSDGTTLSASTSPTVAYFTATSTTASVFPYASTTAMSASGSAYFATSGGSVGIGTTSPSTKLSVGGAAGDTTGHGYFTGGLGVGILNTTANTFRVGQCVTGDTKLRRRRRRKKSTGKRSDLFGDSRSDLKEDDFDNDYIYDEVMIKDIAAGDEIASLDEKTGKIVWSKVKQLAYMGKKDIIELVTALGRKIRTTGNHPYLVKTTNNDTMNNPRQEWHLGLANSNPAGVGEHAQTGSKSAANSDASGSSLLNSAFLALGSNNQSPFGVKTAVFIDYANIKAWAREKGLAFDLKALYLALKSAGAEKILFYYGTDSKNTKSLAFLNKMRQIGFEVITKPVKYFKISFLNILKQGINSRMLKKLSPVVQKVLLAEVEKLEKARVRLFVPKSNFDVEIGLDAVLFAEQFDNFVIFSGDGDIVSIIKYLKSKGKRVTIIAGKKYMAGELIKTSDKFIRLEKLAMDINGLLKELVNNENKKTPDEPGEKSNCIVSSQDFSSSPKMWTKASGLKHGREIAILGKNGWPAWDRVISMQELPEEDVYDVEIENTHNFIGNDIVAHNTAFMVDSTGNVGIGTAAPGYKLDIAGDTNISAGSAYKYNGSNVVTASTTLNNYFFGNAGNLTATGDLNNGVGLNALNGLTTGVNNDAMGAYALRVNTTGNSNTALGHYTLFSNTTGARNTAVGNAALFTNVTGYDNTAIGYLALYNSTGVANTALGHRAGDDITTGSNNLIIGYDIDAPSATLSNQLNIGNLIFSKGIDGTGTTLSTGNIGIGTTSPYAKLSVEGSSALGNSALAGYFIATSTTATSTFAGGLAVETSGLVYDYSTNNVGIGLANPAYKLEVQGSASTTNLYMPAASTTVGIIYSGTNRFIHNFGTSNFFAGVNAGNLTMTGTQNTAVGLSALTANTTGIENVAIGKNALDSNTSGSYNVSIGSENSTVNTTGQYNVAVGRAALESNTGSNNTALGTSALQLSTGGNNIGIGYSAGDNITTGANNLILGYDIDAPSATASNQMSIGNLIYSAGVNGAGTGFSTGNIGISSSTPWAKLSVHGLATDADTSKPLFLVASSTASATTTHFIITNTGNVGIGTGAPGQKLSVSTTIEDIANFNTTHPTQSRISLSNNGAIRGYIGVGGLSTGAAITDFVFRSEGGIVFDIQGGPRVNILNNGNVGIGTTSPYAKLSVEGSSALGNSALAGYFTATTSTASVFPYASTTAMSASGSAYAANFVASSASATSTFAGGLAVETSGLVYDYSTGYVGIGLANPAYKLEVQGSASTTNLYLPAASTTVGIIYSGANRFIHNFGTSNFFAGVNAGNLTTTGTGFNNGIGTQALTAVTTGHSNNAIGYQSLFNNTTGARNQAFGLQSLYSNTTGNDNAGFGHGALGTNISGNQNTAVGGGDSLSYILGSDNTAVGFSAGRGPTGPGISSSANTLIGSYSGFPLNTGSGNNTMVGYRSGFANTSGANNLLLGYQSGDNITTGSNNLIIGYDIDAPSATASNQLNIGNLIFSQGINGTGTTLSTGNIGIGTTSPYAKLSVEGSSALGNSALAGYFTATTSTASVFPYASTTAMSASGSAYFATSGGNVGIGTTNPDDKLDIVGNVQISGNIYVSRFIDNDNPIYYVDPNAATSAVFAGLVGIGTTSPYAKLSVEGSSVLGNSALAGYFTATTSTASVFPYASTTAMSASGSAYAANFTASSASATSTFAGGLAVETSGLVYDYSTNNVGIGTAAPGAKLHVAGGALRIDENQWLDTANISLIKQSYFGNNSNLKTIQVGTNKTVSFGVDVSAIAGVNYSAFNELIVPNNFVIRNVNSAGTDFLWSLSINNGMLGIGGIGPTGSDILALNGDTSRNIRMGRNTNSNASGSNLGLLAGGSTVGSTDKDGGTLVLSGGISTGTGSSQIQFQTATAGATGTTDRTPDTKMTILATGNIGIGTTSPYAKLSVEGSSALGNSALAGYFTATTSTASVFPYASTTALTVSGNSYLGTISSGLWNGTLIGVPYGGTGWAAIQSGTIPYGNGASALSTTTAGTAGNVLAFLNGVPTWTATSTLSEITGTLSVAKGGTGQTSFGQGWLNSNGTTLSASTSPTVAYLTATSTTATSTFAGGLAVETSGLVYDYSTNNVGIGTAAPGAKLDVVGEGKFISSIGRAQVRIAQNDANPDYGGMIYLTNDVGATQKATRLRATYGGVGSNTYPNFAIDRSTNDQAYGSDPSSLTYVNSFTIDGSSGNIGIGTVSPQAKLEVIGSALLNGQASAQYFTATSTTATSTFAGGLAVETSGLVYDYSTNNVGIGLANPAYKLEVQGSASTTNLYMPAASTTVGIIYSGTNRFIHNFGTNNIFVGLNAGNLTTTGSGLNNAFGYQALTALTTGQSNNAFGYQALVGNTTGARNNAMGVQALYSNTTGTDNVGFGQGTVFYNVSGTDNTGIGSAALQNTTGSSNTAVGSNAGLGVVSGGSSFSNTALLGFYAGSALSTGSNNILLGYRAGDAITTGSNNLILGYDVDAPSATASNQLNIGNLIFSAGVNGVGTGFSTGNVGVSSSTPWAKLSVHGLATDSDTSKPLFLVASSTASATTTHFIITNTGNVGIGRAAPAYPLDVLGTGTGAIIARFNDVNSTGCTLATGGTISCSSDLSLKKNIEDIGDGLNKVLGLHPVLFNWKSEDNSSSTLKNLGFIAQEVELILPKLVSTENGGVKQLNTIGMIPVLAKAIQEQQEMIEGLKQAMASTTDLIASLSAGTSGVQSSSGVISQSFAWILNQFKISGVVFEYDALKVKNVEAEKVKTKEICVGNTCVTEDQFKAFFGSSVASSSSGQASSATDVSSPSSSSLPAEATSSSSSNSFSSESSTDTSNSSSGQASSATDVSSPSSSSSPAEATSSSSSNSFSSESSTDTSNSSATSEVSSSQSSGG